MFGCLKPWSPELTITELMHLPGDPEPMKPDEAKELSEKLKHWIPPNG